jgi:hypothetical protein
MLYKRVLIIAALFMFSLGAVPAATGQMGPGKMGGGMMSPETRMKHHEAMGEFMEMVKETMDMVKNISHVPSAAQKKRLTEMINRMDEIIKNHKEIGTMMHGK